MIERASLLFLLLAAAASAQDGAPIKPPTVAWQEILLSGTKAAHSDEAPEIQKASALAYLANWKKAVEESTGVEALHLARIYLMAGRVHDGLARLRSLATDAEAPVHVRNQAWKQWAFELARYVPTLEPKAMAEVRRVVNAPLPDGLDDTAHAQILRARGMLAYAAGDVDAAVDAWTEMTRVRPQMATIGARLVIPALMTGVCRLEDYDGLRGRIQQAIEGFAKTAGQRGAGWQGRAVDRMTARLDLLGRSAKEWTLVHAFGETKTVASLKGKVTLLYFWQTESAASVSSLPVLRDLAKTGVAVVGVTLPGRSVWPSRYELDAAMMAKAGRPDPIRLAWGQASPDEVAAFRAKEKKLIARFLENHAMKWPVVMIDEKESSNLYGRFGALPHIVILDAAGRIRYVKTGRLRRGDFAATKELPKVIETLLAGN